MPGLPTLAPRLGKLAPEDQPRQFGPDGGEVIQTRFPPGAPQGFPQQGLPQSPGFGASTQPKDPLAPDDYTPPGLPPPEPEPDNEALDDQEVTPGEADAIPHLYDALSKALEDDEANVPADSLLLKSD